MRVPHILVGLAVTLAMQARAQSVISAHSGLILSSDGTVLVDGKPLTRVQGRFSELAKGSVLTTEEGKAEILLGPGVILWLGHRGSIRMHDNTLADARLELVSGAAVLESSALTPDTAVTLLFGDWQFTAPEHGLYRIDLATLFLSAREGTATLSRGAEKVAVSERQRLNLATLALDAVPEASDDLDRWSAARREAIAAANLNGMIQTGALPPKPRRPWWRRPFPSAVSQFPGRIR